MNLFRIIQSVGSPRKWRDAARSDGRRAAPALHAIRRSWILLPTVVLLGVGGGAAATPAASPGAAAACAATPAVDPGALLPNGRQPLPGVITGGQPTSAQLTALAAAGYKTLINLRSAEEHAPALGEESRELGVRYIELPVAGVQDLTAEKVAALGKLLADRAATPVVIYCGSGNRAGALLALEQAQVEGKPPEAALAVGLAAGLTRLEPAVRELLKLPPAPAAPPVPPD